MGPKRPIKPPKTWPKTVLLAALLVVTTAAVFSPVLRLDFLDWDDRGAVQRNPDFNPPTLDSLGHYWTGTHLQFYVPVTYTTWWLVAHVAGTTGASGVHTLDPGPFHAINLLAHVCNAVLVFVILRKLVRRDGPAWFGAAVFALHPIQVEPVAWVSSMYSSLSGSFALLATWQYLAFSDRWFGPADKHEPALANQKKVPRAWLHFAAAGACYALALLTKPTILLLPVIWVVLDVGLRRRPLREVAVPAGALLLAMAPPIAIVTRTAQPGSLTYSPLWLRPLVAGDTLAFYVGKIVYPRWLLPDYGRSPRWLEQHRPWVFLTWLAPAALLVAGLALWRRTRWPFVVVLVFVVALVPMLGLAPFDYQRYSTVADRYVYFAMVAPAMLAGWAISRASAGAGARVASIAGSLVVVLLAVLSSLQVMHWSDSRTLFEHELRGNPRSLLAHSVFGYFKAAENKPDEALAEYREALKANPGDPRVLYDMGNVYLRTRRWEDAIACYKEAAITNPYEDQLFSNMAIAYAQSGRGEEATQALLHALELNPRNADAHLNLAIVLVGHGDLAGAREHYEAVIRLNGNVAAAQRGLSYLQQFSR
jgi:tetratricopeptide (TPR) repeat protein